MKALDRLNRHHEWTEQLTETLLGERHMRRALREQLLADCASELALEAELLGRACARAHVSSPPDLDAEFVAARTELRCRFEALAAVEIDAASFEERARAFLVAAKRHGAQQRRWLVPFLATRLEARDAA